MKTADSLGEATGTKLQDSETYGFGDDANGDGRDDANRDGRDDANGDGRDDANRDGRDDANDDGRQDLGTLDGGEGLPLPLEVRRGSWRAFSRSSEES